MTAKILYREPYIISLMKEDCKTQQKRNIQRQKEARGIETWGKGWELNGFVVHLGWVYSSS